jgi:hypothetical protein
MAICNARPFYLSPAAIDLAESLHDTETDKFAKRPMTGADGRSSRMARGRGRTADLPIFSRIKRRVSRIS